MLERREVIADPPGAAKLRSEFQLWLSGEFRLDDDRLNSLTMAVNEALANAVEHAYAGLARPGTVDLVASYDAARDELTVEIADRGRWQDPVPDPLHLRGRGIPLMEAFAERTSFERSESLSQLFCPPEEFRCNRASISSGEVHCVPTPAVR